MSSVFALFLIITWMMTTTTQVIVVPESSLPDGILGVSCDARFLEIEGNRQQLCPESYKGIVLSERVAQGENDQETALLKNVLKHEQRHVDKGPDGGPDDPFNERAARETACEFSWVRWCTEWLAPAEKEE